MPILYECCVLAVASYQSVPNGMMFTREFTLIFLLDETTDEAKEMAFGFGVRNGATTGGTKWIKNTYI